MLSRGGSGTPHPTNKLTSQQLSTVHSPPSTTAGDRRLQYLIGACCMGRIPKRFLHSIRCFENLSSGENRAEINRPTSRKHAERSCRTECIRAYDDIIRTYQGALILWEPQRVFQSTPSVMGNADMSVSSNEARWRSRCRR